MRSGMNLKQARNMIANPDRTITQIGVLIDDALDPVITREDVIGILKEIDLLLQTREDAQRIVAKALSSDPTAPADTSTDAATSAQRPRLCPNGTPHEFGDYGECLNCCLKVRLELLFSPSDQETTT